MGLKTLNTEYTEGPGQKTQLVLEHDNVARHITVRHRPGRFVYTVRCDRDRAIYDLFLDSDRQYSCGYFTEGADLEEAQLAKKRHLAAKLAIEPGQRVLDIGSGWGGLGLYLAKAAHCDVTGVTLSSEQLKISRERTTRE